MASGEYGIWRGRDDSSCRIVKWKSQYSRTSDCLYQRSWADMIGEYWRENFDDICATWQRCEVTATAHTTAHTRQRREVLSSSTTAMTRRLEGVRKGPFHVRVSEVAGGMGPKIQLPRIWACGSWRDVQAPYLKFSGLHPAAARRGGFLHSLLHRPQLCGERPRVKKWRIQ